MLAGVGTRGGIVKGIPVNDPRSILDPERDLFAPPSRRDFGSAGVALLIAVLALALTVWALSGGVASLGSVDDPVAESQPTVTTEP